MVLKFSYQTWVSLSMKVKIVDFYQLDFHPLLYVYKLTLYSKGLGRVVKNTSLQQQQVLKSLVSYQTAALDHPEWSGALL